MNGGAGGAVPGGLGLLGPPSWDQDQSYFSEPEFDSEYQHQHIHKSKVTLDFIVFITVVETGNVMPFTSWRESEREKR